MSHDIEAVLGQILPEIADLRHELHQHPEIRFQERWTADRIARFLDAHGIPHRDGLAKGTGIVATVEGNGKRVVALRADIDALEIQEETGLPYASRIPQRMHACGHDGHTAILCGTGAVLMRLRDRLPCTVRLLFQPAEEQAGGARFMVADGAVDGVDAVFGLHGWPGLALGRIATKPGPFMASADFFRIVVRGRGCHGADPAAGIDPIVVAAHITTALQTIVSRELDPREPAIVTVAHIDAGATTNIIPDTAFMEGTIRSFDPRVDAALRESVDRVARNIAKALRATAETQFGGQSYPALVNSPDMTRHVCDCAADTLGPDAVEVLDRPVMVSEDFACYLEAVPGAFFFLGVNANAGKPCPSLHTPQYDFPDAALPIGIRLMTRLALGFTG